MLIPFPFAFLTGAFLFDVAGRLLRRPDYSATGRHLTAAGIGSGLLAAVPGIIDYFGVVPPKSSAKRRATKHALSNVSALTLFGLGWALRRNGSASGATLAAEGAGVGMMSIGGWLGGTLVYRNQIGVDHRYADAGKWKEERLPAAGEQPALPPADDDLGLNQMKLVHVDGRRVAVGRTEEGTCAFDDRCTHRGGPLSDGVLINGTVQCPWHGSQFDVRTGQVKCGPATDPIATYPTAESSREVRVRVEVDAPVHRE